MAKRLIKKDETSGKEVWMHDDDKGYVIEETQHVTPLLDENKRKANGWQYGQMTGNTQKHWQQVAEIPNVIYLQLVEKFGAPKDNPTAWKKWLNDYDNRYFRTGGGSL